MDVMEFNKYLINEMCPLCNSNKIICEVKDVIGYISCEVEYSCEKCGIIGYWSYGNFDPSCIYKGKQINNTFERCDICNKPVTGFEYEYCCNGQDCGCMGQPLTPCICSEECNEAMKGNGTFEARRIRAGIELYEVI